MITHVLTALILSAGIEPGWFTPETAPTAAALSADTGGADTGSSDDTGGSVDTGTDTATADDSGNVNGNVNADDTADTGSDSQSSGATYSASDLAGEKGGCSTAPGAPAHLAWLMLAVVGWRRRTA